MTPRPAHWQEWPLPGDAPQAYAVYVDERDIVWLTDFGANAIVRFDPAIERFDAVELPSPDAAVRQLLGRPGELWGRVGGRQAGGRDRGLSPTHRDMARRRRRCHREDRLG